MRGVVLSNREGRRSPRIANDTVAVGLFHHEPGVIVAAPERMEPTDMALARVTRPAAYPPPDRGRMLMAWEASTAAAPKPKLLDRVREILRTRHYSRRTESYIARIRRYIFFHSKRHPAEMGGPEVTRFSQFSRGRGSRGRLDPEPGAERAPLPLSR